MDAAVTMGDVVCMGVAEKNLHDDDSMTLIVKNHPRKNFFRKNVVISIPYFYCIVKKTM